ncbi:MAG: single-stranded-DNA-specific exonuclease RecJ [Candidatus Pacebacteria bacterium]|nr:single-stranded-DNA-specific exonuclease RecJ [Candidatus Paceibacterota bacterium]
MKWEVLSTTIPQNFSELEKILLENRDITDAQAFFDPPHPSELSLTAVGIDAAAMQLAVRRIRKAITAKEKVVVFGDYDADGICATTVLWQTLVAEGVQALPFLPNRLEHGYGLSVAALDDLCAEEKPALIITVDNGIVAHEAAQAAKERGIDLIITDHHMPESGLDNLPPALAIVHTTKLCGTTVAWFLARELAPEQAADQLDLCAIATVADQVPLTEFNRSFAYHGLVALRETTRPGLLALVAASTTEQAAITSSSIGFQIAPLINAAGRVGDGYTALRLLCTTKERAARALAQELTAVNTERKELTHGSVVEAELQVATQLDQSLIIVSSTEYHEGVIGLVAGRLSEQYHRPAIAIAIGEDQAKGSARSVRGINIVEIIREVREDLLSVGGHPLAAGFSLTTVNLELVTKRLLAVAQEKIDAHLLIETKRVECELPHDLVTLDTVDALTKFEPFGMRNNRPRFLLKNVTVLDIRSIGKAGKHCKLRVELETGEQLPVLWWNCGDTDQAELEAITELAVKLDVNEWRGKRSLQLVV